jgi:protein SCO1/2
MLTERRLAPILLVCLLAPACQRQAKVSAEQRYPLAGRVVKIEAAERTITIDHQDIPGFMPAMTMPFVVLERDAALLARAAPGDSVTATLVSRDSRFWLEDLVLSRGTADPAAPLSTGLREARPGDPLPDVALVDQDGKPFRTSLLRGRATALSFVFTRCPLPEFCPLMMRNFATVEAELLADPTLLARTRLLTVSFDTRHDTPQVLRSFGLPFQKTSPPFSHWILATGEQAAIRVLGIALELDYSEASESFTHNLRTAVVGPDGKLRRLFRGNDWTPDELLAALRAAS